MRSSWNKLLLLLALVAAAGQAVAAITCTSITSPGVSINYASNTTASVQTFFTVSCTRASVTDPGSVSYEVTADHGLHSNGQNNQAELTGARLRYDVFTSSTCNSPWGGTRKISDAISWPNGATGTITRQTNFWGCIVTAQTPPNSGAYTDTIGLTMAYGNSTLFGSLPVAIYAPSLCTVVTPAGDLNLSYTAFEPQVSRSTIFAVTCTNGMPYSITTDVSEAVLTGVRYSLGVDNGSSNGTGAPQAYMVTATIPSGQAGTCLAATCSARRTHTLTISY